MKKLNTLKVRRERAEEFCRGHDAYTAAVKRDFRPLFAGGVVANQCDPYDTVLGGLAAQQQPSYRNQLSSGRLT